MRKVAGKAAKLRRIDGSSKVLPKTSKDRQQIVDEFGRLARQLENVKSLLLRYEQLRGRISDWFADADPEKSYSEDGALFSVIVGPRATRRTIIDMPKLYERVGLRSFLEICSVSLEKLDDVLLPKDQQHLVAVERTGPRTIKPVAKFVEPAA